VTDYYQCAKAGFTGANIANCPFASAQVSTTTEGNVNLKPITAKDADAGIVWSPLERTSLSVDFIHWKILNEIEAQPSDQLLREESACRLGQLDVNSPTCVAALSQVTRDSLGDLTAIFTPKVNVAQETLNVINTELNYVQPAGRFGNFIFEGSYSNIIKHTFTQFAGDTEINYLENPFFSQDFKTKENLSVTWNLQKFGATVYVERYGETPNYLAEQTTAGYDSPGAGRVGTWTLANLSARYEVLPGLVVSANVVNLFDKAPPIDHSVTGNQNQPYSTLNYNPYGRSYFVTASYNLPK
jgi:iron complex outermembrane recepter protein